MKHSIRTAAFVFLLGILSPHAMDLKVTSGDLKFLKGERSLNVEYKFDNLRVHDLSEEDYIAKKVADYNAKEAGKGDAWLKMWKGDRPRVYYPKFEELFNQMIRERKMNLVLRRDATDAKYTLVLRTTHLETGWNAYVAKRPAFLDAEVDFVETAERGKILATIVIRKAPGRKFLNDTDLAVSTRVGECYAKAGKELGILVSKKASK